MSEIPNHTVEFDPFTEAWVFLVELEPGVHLRIDSPSPWFTLNDVENFVANLMEFVDDSRGDDVEEATP
jgi:hypothetical protein